MLAARVTRFGSIENVQIAEVDMPAVAPGKLLVRTTVAGINFADVGMVLGRQKRREPPFTPGVEAAGIVEVVGDRVDAGDLLPAIRVVYWDPMPAAFAEYAVVDAWRCVPIPEHVADEVAVALMVQGATAHYLTTAASALASGDTCLVYSAAGGVGHLIMQIAGLLGAHPIAVVGADEKTAFVTELGAARVVNRNRDSVLEMTLEATDGEGAHAVYDAIGAATIEQSLRATREGGVCILFGAASGPAPEPDPALVSRFVHKRTELGSYLADAAAYRARLGQLFDWYQAGVVVPRICGEWPLARTAEALNAIAGGLTMGKLVIRIE